MITSSEKIAALLPMKANSSRVPGKNFRSFHGKPLFRWILDSLLEIESIDKVIINTDARSILSQHGLNPSEKIIIRDRKKEICGDDISMNLVIQDDIDNISSETFLMTHTTNPLLSSSSIKRAIARFNQSKADSLFTVNKVQSRFYRADCTPINHDPSILIPTQNLEPWYEENSNLYIFSRKSFNNAKARIGLNPILFETPELESIDIDTESDWDFALLAAKYLQNTKSV